MESVESLMPRYNRPQDDVVVQHCHCHSSGLRCGFERCCKSSTLLGLVPYDVEETLVRVGYQAARYRVRSCNGCRERPQIGGSDVRTLGTGRHSLALFFVSLKKKKLTQAQQRH